jgi:hypothetical protein
MIHTMTNMVIDNIQVAKKYTINTFVKHEGMNKVLTEFVDRQTDYTKKAIHNTVDSMSAIYAIFHNKDFQQETFKSCFMPFGNKGK